SACANLASAICEYSGEYLVHRARLMVASADKGALPPAAEDVLIAAGASLAVALRDGLTRIDWLAHWRFMRRQDDVPRELQPLENIVINYLRPLTDLHGYVVRPHGLGHQPLSEVNWPGPRRERRCVTRSYPGLPNWRVLEDVWVQH